MNKISLEDHFMLPNYRADGPVSFTKSVHPDFADKMTKNLPDFENRLLEMDKAGIDKTVLSLTQPGIQAEIDAKSAVTAARLMNDELASACRRHPDRLLGFAALPLQDPKEAANELERSINELGFVGACVNGYTNLGDADTAMYLDEEPMLEFWEKANSLRVPIYLHPRVPLASQQRIYKGYPALMGSAWGFGHETATHALRLIMSGLFDRYPELTVALGHMGEGLPFLVSRVDHRLKFQPEATRGKQKRLVADYLGTNFVITTSGSFRSQALINSILEIGSDRILFSTDYPFESMSEAANWFDNCPISEIDRKKIGSDNAAKLFKLK